MTSTSFTPHQQAQAGDTVAVLPAPVVRVGLVSRNGQPILSMPIDPPFFSASSTNVSCPQISASVHGFPEYIMADLGKYQPKLELLRYIRKRASSDLHGRGRQNSGFVHPSDPNSPSGNGHRTGGGDHTYTALSVRALRKTEWDITNWGQEIDVTQGALGFMHFVGVRYLDIFGGWATQTLPVPSGSSYNRRHGPSVSYGGSFYPARFKLRWSVIDVSDPKGGRVHGPLSETFSISTKTFPFVKGAQAINSFGQLAEAASISPILNERELNAWVGGKIT